MSGAPMGYETLKWSRRALWAGALLVGCVLLPVYWVAAVVAAFSGPKGSAELAKEAGWLLVEAAGVMVLLLAAADALLRWTAADFPRRSKRAALLAICSGVPACVLAMKLEGRWAHALRLLLF